MIIAMYALIALGSILIYSGSGTDGGETAETPRSPARPKADDDTRADTETPEWAQALRARARMGRVRRRASDAGALAAPRLTVVEDLQHCREADELLVLEYDANGPAPALELTHDDTHGVSRLYADGRLVLKARARPGTPPLCLTEIALAPC